MNLNRISGAGVAVMAVVGALRQRRRGYADAAMTRPKGGVTPDFVKGRAIDRNRLADLVALLDLAESLEEEIAAETRMGAKIRLRATLSGLQAVAQDDPQDLLGRIRFGRFGQWFPIPEERVTENAILRRARKAVARGVLPAGVLQVAEERNDGEDPPRKTGRSVSRSRSRADSSSGTITPSSTMSG